MEKTKKEVIKNEETKKGSCKIWSKEKNKKGLQSKNFKQVKNVRVPLLSYKINSKPSYQSKNVYFRASQAL